MSTHISLEQWKALVAVVEKGGYAKAAEALGKSQSSVSYAVAKLEETLDVRALAIKGRKAELTRAGKVLFQRAKALIDEAEQLEAMASQFTDHWQAEVHIATDTIFPSGLILEALQGFTDTYPHTRIEWKETVLSGTTEAMLSHKVDLTICGEVPPGFLAEHLMRVRFVAVASPEHPLHQQVNLNHRDLIHHRQLVTKDSGSRDIDSGWLGSQQRLTMSNQHLTIKAALRGLGFAWLPEQKILDELASDRLRPLPLAEGVERFDDLYLVYTDGTYASSSVTTLGEMIKSAVANAGLT